MGRGAGAWATLSDVIEMLTSSDRKWLWTLWVGPRLFSEVSRIWRLGLQTRVQRTMTSRSPHGFRGVDPCSKSGIITKWRWKRSHEAEANRKRVEQEASIIEMTWVETAHANKELFDKALTGAITDQDLAEGIRKNNEALEKDLKELKLGVQDAQLQ
jgi:hypothetical protein